ncbi:YqiA/YcfP family alpha/beta fold hydrolase [Dechloromonas sp. ZS-1]|uniref:YqiA/YcfP family alpha/beta fold hydrolase n=1 Tax=Dechloromonas sp. ZS-1 TaxID=3138067 RepID=UPI0031FE0596
MQTLVLFAHGKESGPWGSKIRHLATIAQEFGAQVLSPDYSDLTDPDERVARLLAMPLPAHDRLVLVGSSMGGYVSTVASQTLRPSALFLMAPAFYIPGYAVQTPTPGSSRVSVVFGWHDEVIPVEHGIRFAQAHQAELHVLNSDHRLNSVLPELGILFQDFLKSI